MVCQSGNNQSQRRPSWLWMNIIRKNHPCKTQITPQFSLLVCSHEATDQLHNNDKLHTIKIATLRHIPKTRVNIFQDDTWGWELTDLYVAHGEIVTNRLVPNLVGGGQTNEKTSPERLACLVDQTPKFSNILEDIKKVEEIAIRVDSQSSTMS